MALYRHHQVQQDLSELLQQDIPWQQLTNQSVLVTGATGMLASYFGFMLLYLNERLKLNIKPVFLARSREKLTQVYGDALAHADCIMQDVSLPIVREGAVDYIFHAAGAASPFFIQNDPVGILRANVLGTMQVVELARRCETKNIVFASTREVYGRVDNKERIHELDMGLLDPLNPRDCYPESKRLAETMLMAYHTQYQVNFNTVRLAHTYGPGMPIECDGRVMSDLIGAVVAGRDTVLNSDGEAERAFCYISDAVAGIFRVLLQGDACHAYNLANEDEPIKIKDLAYLLQAISGNNKAVRLEPQDNSGGYTNYKRTAMDTSRLVQLGWRAQVDLRQGLGRTLQVCGDPT